MSIFSWISGGSKTADKALSIVESAGDALFFTNEEKSVASQKKLDWILKYQAATSPQNVVRRLISIGVVGLWVFLVLLAVIAKGLGADEYSQFLFDTLTDVVMQPFSIIIGFYFLSQVVRSMGK